MFEYRSIIGQWSLIAACLVATVAMVSYPQYVAAGQLVMETDLLVDPTRPAGWMSEPARQAKVARPKVRVDYILYSQHRKMVSINGKSVLEGRDWNGVKVLKVEAKRVLLSWQGQRWFAAVTSAKGTGNNPVRLRRTQ